MIESRCGILCSECDWREKVNCAGCVNIQKPFWGDFCPVKSCCEGRRHEHCGQCEDFPCKLATSMSYAEEEGDNGKRLAQCCLWAGLENSFDPEKLIHDVVTQNANALPTHFAKDAVICWHDSNEQLTVPEYIRANCEYPGDWQGKVLRTEKTSDGVFIVTKIWSETSTHFVSAFAKLENGKIIRLDEYYSDLGEPPQWRKDMNIGKPIEEN